MKPIIVDEKIVLTTPFFKVKKRKLLYGKKKKTYYDIFRTSDVLIFPLSDKGELYLIEQYRYLHLKVLKEAVAGHIDEGESALKAAQRELQEEVGIQADQMEEFARMEGGGSIIRSTTHFFLAKGLSFGNANPEEDEDIQLLTTTLAEAVKDVMEGKIRNSSTALGILILDKLQSNQKQK